MWGGSRYTAGLKSRQSLIDIQIEITLALSHRIHVVLLLLQIPTKLLYLLPKLLYLQHQVGEAHDGSSGAMIEASISLPGSLRTILPSTSRITRSARRATLGLCVTTRSVSP